MPISKERMVPETAPTANSTPSARAQVRASRPISASPRYPRHSANTTIAGKATPKAAMTMCQPRDRAICERAYTKSAGEARATASTASSAAVREAGGDRTQAGELGAEDVARLDRHHAVHRARQHHVAGPQARAQAAELVRQPCHTTGRVAERRGAGAG